MGKRILCETCQIYIGTQEEKQRHDYAYHVAQICPVCGNHGSGFLNMKAHVQRVHPREWTEIERSLSKSQDGHETHQ